jgi:RimJ/RimL family protein N-acetyltransferase
MTSTQPNLQPTLTGPNVLIRPLRADDWAEMYAAASDPLIWEVHPVHDRWQEPVFRVFFEAALATESGFTIIDRANGAIIGTSRYGGYDPIRREIEIGWTFIARSHWGGVTNAEMKRLMLDHAFTFVDCVTFQVGETNYRSRGAMCKIGGVLRDETVDVVLNGATIRHVVFEICKQQ